MICFKYYKTLFRTMLFISLTFPVDFIGRIPPSAKHLWDPHIGTFRHVLFTVDSRRLGEGCWVY